MALYNGAWHKCRHVQSVDISFLRLVSTLFFVLAHYL